MTLREYIDALLEIEAEYKTDGYKAEDLTIRGYLLGSIGHDAVLMTPIRPYGDGLDVLLDWERRNV